MEHDLGVPLLLPSFLSFFLFCFSLRSNHSKVFAAVHLGSLFVCGGVMLLMMTDDKRKAKPAM